MAQQECKDEYEVLETSKVERSSYPAKRTINSKLSEAETAFIQQKFMADRGTFGQVLECLDNENLEHLAMMERLLGPLPQHMIISADLHAEKYFKRSARLDWLKGASSKESMRGVWKLPRIQNSKFKCFSGILRCPICIGSLPTQPSDPTTDIPTTTTTTFENPKRNFKTQVKTPGVVARLMGLDSLPDPGKVFRRNEDQKEKVELMGLDGLPPQQPLHRQHKGFSETYRQWTASVSTQSDGKPYEHRSNWKDSMAQQECKDEYEVLETSKVERSSYPAKRTINSKLSEANMAFIQQKFIADCGLHAEKYFKRSARLDWLAGASSKESTRAVWKLPRLLSQNSKFKCFSGILRCLLCIGSLPTQPSDPTTDIPTTTTTIENPKKNFKTQAKTPGVVARLMVHIDGRPPNVIARLMGLHGLPPQQPLHRQRKGFSETYRQWTASISSQRDGKPYEHRSNRKDSMAQQECKDEYEVLETSKVKRSSYPAKRTINSKLSKAKTTFIQQKFMTDHGYLNLGHLKETVQLQCPAPEPQSPASSKEVDHPSWVSVLEAPFVEDVNWLPTQLKLLIKMESRENADGLMLTPSDKDVGQGFVSVSEDNDVFNHESWESVYLANVLIDSGYDDADPNTFVSTWYFLDCPLDPCLFDNVEEKYSNKTTSSSLTSQKHGIGYELHKLLASEEKSMHEDVSKRVLDREM
ncbi:unnamed protein product [Camellia sinensis]